MATINGWVATGKYEWRKGGHIIKIRPTDSRKPRGTKTVWLVETKKIGGTSARLGYCQTYDEGKQLAMPFLRRW